jgi:hypothetical protein
MIGNFAFSLNDSFEFIKALGHQEAPSALASTETAITLAWTMFPCSNYLVSFYLPFQVGSAGVRLTSPTGAAALASCGAALLASDVPSELITGSCLSGALSILKIICI